MRTEIVLRTGADEASRRCVDGITTLGGSRADGIPVPGLSPAAIQLEPHPSGVIIRPTAPGLRVAGHTVPPGSCRLLRPGQCATLHALVLELPAPTADGPTRVSAAALLRESLEGRAGPPGPHLVFLTGNDVGERIAIGAELVIGRGRGATLRVRDPAASRRHARIRIAAGLATIEDLGAKNRLRVNGVGVERRPLSLRAGDRVTIGTTELVYEDGAGAAVKGAQGQAGEPAPERARGLGGRASPDPPARADRPLRAVRPAAPRGPRRKGPRPGAHPLVAAGLLAASAAVLAAVSSCGP